MAKPRALRPRSPEPVPCPAAPLAVMLMVGAFVLSFVIGVPIAFALAETEVKLRSR